MKTRQTRTRKIHLPITTHIRQIEAIVAELNNIEAVTSLTIDSTDLTINYNFPDLVISSVWQIINHHTDTIAFNYVDKLWYGLIAWKEDNERDHLYSRSGWDRYIQDIYVGHTRHEYSNTSKFKAAPPPGKAPAKPLKRADN